jgi:hypothetical protein
MYTTGAFGRVRGRAGGATCGRSALRRRRCACVVRWCVTLVFLPTIVPLSHRYLYRHSHCLRAPLASFGVTFDDSSASQARAIGRTRAYQGVNMRGDGRARQVACRGAKPR